jgi:uncharacterized protein (DUF58 family)
MTPSLTPTGLLLCGVGAAFVVTGAAVAAWPLVALGTLQLSALLVLYLLFIPTSALLKRRYLEFAWWVPASETGGGALVAERPLMLHLLFRNHTPRRLALARMRILSSSTIRIHEPHLATVLPAQREIRLKVRVTPQSAGYWFFHGIALRITDRFGVFALHVYYPNLMDIKVFPPLGVGRTAIPFRPRTGAFHERAGLRTVRQAGLGSDLREIREHIPGDPFKRIAWKATARTRRLMVREFESEIVVTHWLLLDISSTMRNPPAHGSASTKTKLDYALSLCAGFARAALEAGDRVGLITFDHRIFSQVKPSDGNPQLYRIIDRLLELHSIVDEDLTDLTDPELYAAVAEYLAYQEGIDVQRRGRPPGREDPAWDRLVVGPHGELYYIEAMERAAARALARRSAAASGAWRFKVLASSRHTTELRRFCRLCGLEIPYRQHSFLAGKERGMAAAISRAAASRHSQFIVLVTDLEEIEELRGVLDALKMARRKSHSLTVIAPFGPAFTDARGDLHSQRVQNIYSLRARRLRRGVQGSIERLGIPVLSATPHDALLVLMRRLAQARLLRAG